MKLNLKFEEQNSSFSLKFEEQNNDFALNFGEIVDLGGSGLPTVTKKDDGKILQVDDGVWAKKDLPPCDTALSPMSVNAVQNKVIATKFAEVEITIGNIDVLLGTL